MKIKGQDSFSLSEEKDSKAREHSEEGLAPVGRKMLDKWVLIAKDMHNCKKNQLLKKRHFLFIKAQFYPRNKSNRRHQ